MTRRRGDTETPATGNGETGVIFSLRRRVPVSPRRILFAPSPCPRVAASDSFRPVAPSEEGKTIDVNSRRGLRGV